MTVTIHQGDCREVLRTLPEASVQCVITSPPYWGLRDYGAEGQIGRESTVHEYVEVLVGVFQEVRRVLRDDGTLWLNLGDSYISNGGHTDTKVAERRAQNRVADRPEHAQRDFRCRPSGTLKPKDLAAAPWRVALALQDDGWYLRSEIIWSKPNALPESVKDRPCRAHEQVFLLAKSPRYFYDAAAVREPAKPESSRRGELGFGGAKNEAFHECGRQGRKRFVGVREMGPDRNLRTVWSINVACNTEAHFATFPESLVVPCILAGSRGGDSVLDPFGGVGTVGRVAEQLGRHSILIEINPSYIETAKQRTAQCGLFVGK